MCGGQDQVCECIQKAKTKRALSCMAIMRIMMSMMDMQQTEWVQAKDMEGPDKLLYRKEGLRGMMPQTAQNAACS